MLSNKITPTIELFCKHIFFITQIVWHKKAILQNDFAGYIKVKGKIFKQVFLCKILTITAQKINVFLYLLFYSYSLQTIIKHILKSIENQALFKVYFENFVFLDTFQNENDIINLIFDKKIHKLTAIVDNCVVNINLKFLHIHRYLSIDLTNIYT